MPRIFIAIDLPKEIKDYLFELQKQIQKQLDVKVKWTAKKNLHLTLKFLGDISEQQLTQLKKHLQQITFKKFEASLNQIGFFPSSAKPRILWVDLHPPTNIINLQQLIDQETLFISTREQEFKTHLTLGRIKLIKNKETIKSLQKIKIQNKKTTITKFQLMQSTLTKDGPKYTTLQEYELN